MNLARPLMLIAGVLASCAKPVEVPFALAVNRTGDLLKSKPTSEIFSVKRLNREDSVIWSFNEGPYRKSEVIFPMEVKVAISPARGGDATKLRVEARKRGLFFSDKHPDIAAKWRDTIIYFIESTS